VVRPDAHTGGGGARGLFSTADDLARFADDGAGECGVRLFSPLTVRRFTAPQSPPDQPVLRGLGWDLDSPYSGPRGDLLPVGSYGHTGFTGTSLWIDPATESFVILLANSVHPKPRPAITPLRGRVATIVAASLGVDVPGVALAGYNETMAGAGVRRVVARNAQVLTGLDVLAEENSRRSPARRAHRNHTGWTACAGTSTMIEGGESAGAVPPEHGIWAARRACAICAIRRAGCCGACTREASVGGRQAEGTGRAGVRYSRCRAQFYTYITTMVMPWRRRPGRAWRSMC
jgi:hypothetical protein